MSLVHLLWFSLLSWFSFATPLGSPAILKRQDATPTTPGAAESTICGDIVVAANNGTTDDPSS
jgi:hypothetical protein